MGTRPGHRRPSPFILLTVEPVRRAACSNCNGFAEVRIRRNGQLHSVSCPVCVGALVVAR
ncbi:hypothetical protein DR950_41895 [Kitasatospora xanthocidica]|uniref:Uncharacterized protein n=1 Tax=Kitasatospora xanthocidica TaxID=83382 RepID=A0A372ZHV0_9ACTN|nr:hypothetical protein DR950_41895 [Kitasatospora xanthocidica]